MADYNKTTFIGRLGADPEIRSFQNGGRVANFRIAVGEKWKDKSTGEQKESTEWVSVACTSDGLVGVIEKFLRKGSRVFVEGKQKTRKWQDQQGNDRYSTECVIGFGGQLIMLDGKPSDGGQSSGGAPASSSDGAFDDDLNDDVPF